MNPHKPIDSSNNFGGNQDNVDGSIENLDKFQNSDSNSNKGSQGNINRTTKILIAGVIIILIICAIVIPVAIVKSNQNNDDGDENDGTTQIGFCEANPQQCSGTSPEIQNFINSFIDKVKAESALNFLKSMNQVSVSNPESYSDNFRQIMKLSECLKTVMPDSSDDVFRFMVENSLNTPESAMNYLRMIGNFSGQPIQISNGNENEINENCAEIHSQTNSRLLQSSSVTCPTVEVKSDSVLVYVYPTLIDPSKLWDQLYLLNGIASSNNVDSVIAIGATIAEGKQLFVAQMITKVVEGVTINGVSIKLDIVQALQFTLLLLGIRGEQFIPLNQRQNFRHLWLHLKTSSASFFSDKENFDTKNINSFAKTQILKGKKVVLLSHSQGSNIVDKVFESLTSEEKTQVGKLYIAPTGSDLGEGVKDYVLNDQDTFLPTLVSGTKTQGLNQVLSLQPKGTGAEFSTLVDFGFNHELLGYLLFMTSDIGSAISTILSSLNEPENAVNQGLITALIQWEDDSVQSLSITEPDGTVVNSENKVGKVGQIDLTGSEEMKLEHYFAECSKVTVGQYNFSVSTNSSVPISGKLIITAGTEMFVKDYVLSNKHHDIATVHVRQRSNGRFVFNISSISSNNQTNNTPEENETVVSDSCLTPEIEQYANQFEIPLYKKGVLALSNSLCKINHIAPHNYSTLFREIFAISECLEYLDEDKVDSVLVHLVEKQFQTPQHYFTYLNMLGNFSGEPIASSSEQDLVRFCPLYIEGMFSSEEPVETPCSSQTDIDEIVYVYPIWLGPTKLANHLAALRKATSEHNIGNVVAVAPVSKVQWNYLYQAMNSAAMYNLEGKFRDDKFTHQQVQQLTLFFTQVSSINSLPVEKKELIIEFWTLIKMDLVNEYRRPQNFFATNIENYVRKQILKGKRIVLVSHGEASSITHRVLQSLQTEEKQSIGALYIAPTKSDLNEGISRHVTYADDKLIKKIIEKKENGDSYLDTPSPSNTELIVDMPDTVQDVDLGYYHELKFYTKHVSEFITQFQSVLEVLTSKQASIGGGLLSANIEWEDDSLQSLSIIEPDGTVVNSENKVGTVGQIDLTGSEEVKLEHYFAECSKITVGQYNFSVSLKQGLNPSFGKLIITFGSQTFVKNYVFTSLGQNIDLLSVNLALNEKNQYVFSVVQVYKQLCPSQQISQLLSSIDDISGKQFLYAFSVQLCNIETATKEGQVEIFRNLFEIDECSLFFLQRQYSDYYTTLIELRPNATNTAYDFLYMIGNFSGEAIKKSSEEQLKIRCPQIAPSLQIEKEESTQQNPTNKQQCHSQGGEGVLIYLYPKWQAPNLLLEHLSAIKNTITQTEINQFVALGPTVSEGKEDYFLDIIRRAKQGVISIQPVDPLNFTSQEEALQRAVVFTTISSYSYQNDFFYHVRMNGTTTLLGDSNYFNTTHIEDYVRKQLQKGKKVILFTYLEGSNIAFNVMNSLSPEERESVGSVYIVPSRNQLGPGVNDYVLNENDLFVAIIKAQAQKQNENFVTPLDPRALHTLQSQKLVRTFINYLLEMKISVDKAIENVYENLRFAIPTIFQTIVTVSLEWEDDSDHDLFILEPDGTKVSQQNKQGSVGLMQTSGKKHSYVVLCRKLIPGIFKISASSNLVANPSSAKLTVTLGEKVIVKNITHSESEEEIEFIRIGVEAEQNGKHNIYVFEPTACPPQAITEYVADQSMDANQTKSTLALSSYICEVFSPLFVSDVSFSENYREIFKLSQCAKYYLQDSFTDAFIQIYRKQLNSTYQKQKFLEMIEFFDGSPLKTMSDEELQLNCPSIIAGAHSQQITPDCSGDSVKNVLVYVYPTLLAPNRLLDEINGFKQLNGIDEVIALGAQITKTSKSLFTDSLNQLPPDPQITPDILELLSSNFEKYALLSTMISDRKYLSNEQSLIFQNVYPIAYTHLAYSSLTKQDYFDFSKIKPFVERLVLEGKKVVIVSHSYGSNAGQKLFNSFTDQQKQNIGSFYIAPFLKSAQPVLHTTVYYNHLFNAVVGRLSTIYSYTQPLINSGNLDANFSINDFGLNHELLGYLTYGGTQIETKILSMIDSLNQPSTSVTPGPFTVVVEFESSSTYDLFVLQPDNSEVSSEEQAGDIGKVYLSDSLHFLSYSVPCNKIIVGTYNFALELTEGVIPNKVRVTVSIGRQEEVKTFVINQKDSKTNIFSVNVQSLNTQNLKELTFEVQQL